MPYKNADGTMDKRGLALDAKLYYSLFEIVDQAEARALASAEKASNPEISLYFALVKECLRNAQFVYLTDGARLIIEAGEDEAVSCSE